jgi:cytosine/adenosine deaminase-related metal-dependent hydrolase
LPAESFSAADRLTQTSTIPVRQRLTRLQLAYRFIWVRWGQAQWTIDDLIGLASAEVPEEGKHLLDAGVKVSLSTDHIASISCDPFSSMRTLFALHLHRIGMKVPLTLKRLLQLATIDGAVDLGIADRTGSITPGKRADIVLVRTTDINMTPAGDPYEAIVSLGLPTNVDTVIVDGRILRHAGKFTALDHAQIVAEAREAAIGLRNKAKWPT